jgi:hypothetical protein
MAAELIAHATSVATFRHRKQNGHPVIVVVPKSSSRERHVTSPSFSRNIRRLFPVQISSQPMECRRQRLALEFT